MPETINLEHINKAYSRYLVSTYGDLCADCSFSDDVNRATAVIQFLLDQLDNQTEGAIIGEAFVSKHSIAIVSRMLTQISESLRK